MRKFNTHFNIILVTLALVACSPLKEKQQAVPVVELEFTDAKLVQQNSNIINHDVVGNLFLEVQHNLASDVNTIYATASFFEPTKKNILFEKTKTGELSKNTYLPKPVIVDEPCGIPGFPDCPAAPAPQLPPANPSLPVPPVSDAPCGIPGFPDCIVVIKK